MKNASILFDGIVFRKNGLGGVARYVTETVRALRMIPKTRVDLLVPRDAKTPPEGIRHSWERSPKAMFSMMNADVFHSTYYRVWPSMRGKPMVSTVYDWIDASFPFWECNPGSFPDFQKAAVAASAGVVAISQDVKRRTCEIAGIPEDRIVVAYPGLSSTFLQPIPDPEEIRSFSRRITGGAPFLLHVGNRAQYKNFHLVLSAFLSIAGKTDRHLVVVGGERRFPDEWVYEILRSPCHDRVHFFKRLSDADLRLAYAAADAYVSASYMEGFGIPVIEALASGTPVLLSDIPVYREIAGDMAVYIPPSDCDAWAEAMRKDGFPWEPSYRDYVLRSFSWAKTAEAHMRLYRNIVSGGSPASGSMDVIR